MLDLKRNYKLQYLTEGEMKQGLSFSDKGDLFLFYAHLDSVKEFSFGDAVKQGDVIGTLGRSGVKAGTRAPHLHFEIFSKYKMAKTKYRINPAFWVGYKGYDEQSVGEKESQTKENNRGEIKEVNGKKKLIYNNISNFKE